jgi:hypothetical protein
VAVLAIHDDALSNGKVISKVAGVIAHDLRSIVLVGNEIFKGNIFFI